MNKIISFILLCALLIMCFSGCANPSGVIEESPSESQTGAETPPDDSFAGTVLDKNSDLVTTLATYLWERSFVGAEIPGLTLEDKIDKINSGTQLFHVKFDSQKYYFVGAYYTCDDMPPYRFIKEYTWVKFESAYEISEYYKGMKLIEAFQINKASFVTDIISEESEAPEIEHFQLFTAEFKNELNTSAPLIFEETFIYVDVFSEWTNKDVIYYSTNMRNHSNMTIPCISLEMQYYVIVWSYQGYSFEDVDLNSDFIHSCFGKYYDDLMSVIELGLYKEISPSNGRATFYGIIRIDNFASCISNYGEG